MARNTRLSAYLGAIVCSLAILRSDIFLLQGRNVMTTDRIRIISKSQKTTSLFQSPWTGTTTTTTIQINSDHDGEDVDQNQVVSVKTSTETRFFLEKQQQINTFEKPGIYNAPTPLPPLSAFIDNENEKIIGDVSSLLDFAIVGFAKTGTTELTRWLFKQPEIVMRPKEVHHLTFDQPAEMVRHLYMLKRPEVETDSSEKAAANGGMETGKQIRGYKAPRDIADSNVLDLIDLYWHKASLVVGLRHPVSWFESYYNFKVRQNMTMPDATLLDGACDFQFYSMNAILKHRENRYGGLSDNGVCADHARFHVSLSLLGKTNISDPAEEALLGPNRRGPRLASRAPIRNRVFLYEINQRNDDNITRLTKFHQDITKFLGLTKPLVGLPKPAPKRYKAPYVQDEDLLDICQNKYQRLRQQLLGRARQASKWIRSYFLQHPDVFVSQPKHFKSLLKLWHTDPCLDRLQKRT